MAISGVPRIPSWVLPRPRLNARFDSGHAVVLAHAPAGFGKTVAMAHWASKTEKRGVWLRIREREFGSGAFVELLAHEMDLAGAIAGENPLRLAADALAGGADPWHLARTGLRRVGPFALAIDGFDRLHRDTQLAILDLARELNSLSVRAAARQHSVLNEPALRLALDLDRVDARELALTEGEAAAILSAEPSSEAVAEVMDHGAVPLFAKLMQAASAVDDEQHAGSLRSDAPVATLADLVDSFIRLQLATAPIEDALLNFITAVSLADVMDVGLAAELVRVADRAEPGNGPAAVSAEELVRARAMLDTAEAEGLGLWNAGSGGARTFSFTPLIREAFERRLRASGPERVRELSTVVARWELASGIPFAALRRAVELEDWGFVSRVIRTHWNELLRNHGAQLRDLFRGTPLSVLRSHPFVAMLLALEANRQGRSRLRALEYFALSRLAARKQRASATPADRAVLRAIETASLRVSGQFSAALAPALDGYETLLSMSPADRDELGRTEPTLLNQFGTTFFYSNLEEEALAAFARSTAVGEAKGLTGGLQGLALSTGALAVAGDMPESRSLLREAARFEWPEGWLTGYMGSFLQLAEALSALEVFDVETAEKHLRSLDPHRETIEHWPLLAHADALIALLRGEIDQARFRLHAEIRTQQRRRAVSPQTMTRLGRTRALIELAAGNPSAAEKALGKRQTRRTDIGLARISLARGKPQDALRLLLHAGRREGGDRLSARAHAEILALRAGALALMPDERRARAAVREAFAYLGEREQGLALAMMPVHAIDAVFAVADGAGLTGAGSRWSRAGLPAMIPSSRPKSAFTPRELALIDALPRTANNAELARALSISPNTVKTQLRGLYRKLGVGTRAEAFAALAAMGSRDAPAEVAEGLPDPFE